MSHIGLIKKNNNHDQKIGRKAAYTIWSQHHFDGSTFFLQAYRSKSYWFYILFLPKDIYRKPNLKSEPISKSDLNHIRDQHILTWAFLVVISYVGQTMTLLGHTIILPMTSFNVFQLRNILSSTSNTYFAIGWGCQS